MNKILSFFPRHEFERLASEHHEGAKLRSATRWSQFVFPFPWAVLKTTTKALSVTKPSNLSPTTIADIYKNRWEVELFFKWVKQNLKIKSFLGESKNAVMTQIWVAMCSYLIVNFIKTQSKTTKSMQQILRLLNLNSFEKKSLSDLVNGVCSKPPNTDKWQLILKGI